MKAFFTNIVILLPVLASVFLFSYFSHPPRTALEAGRSRASQLLPQTRTATASLQDNEPPKVSIILPEDNSSYHMNSRVPYKIAVSDKEDGESRYDEITSGEVLLEVNYIPGPSYRDTDGLIRPPIHSGLLDLAASNCLYCHAFRGNLIGPSFYQIMKQYQQTKPGIGVIVNRIINGSTGVWGDKVMPGHPELSEDEVKGMLQWINNFAASDEVQYYNGLEGTVELHSDTSSGTGTGVFILTSYYRDHGSGGISKKTGSDRVVLRVDE